MLKNDSSEKEMLMSKDDNNTKRVSRRKFFGYAGAATGLAIGLAACDKNDMDDSGVNLGSGDIGILNYAYALEQLEAAFYTQVIATPYAGMTDAEKTILTDIRDHEVIHRDFFKAALTAAAPTAIIPALEVNFSSIDFSKRDVVLGAAKLFEDTGVAAYNGAGNMIKNTTYLLLAGKIVSVEARHASVIRDLISPKTASFAGDDVVDVNGFDQAIDPATILAAVKPYLKTTVTGANVGK